MNLRTRLREEMATEPNDEEVASAANMNLPTFRRQLLLCDAARNKLIQVLKSLHTYAHGSALVDSFAVLPVHYCNILNYISITSINLYELMLLNRKVYNPKWRS